MVTTLDSEGLREMSSLDSEKTHAYYAPSHCQQFFFLLSSLILRKPCKVGIISIS